LQQRQLTVKKSIKSMVFLDRAKVLPEYLPAFRGFALIQAGIYTFTPGTVVFFNEGSSEEVSTSSFPRKREPILTRLIDDLGQGGFPLARE